jgi:hypothetical protein
MWITNDYWIIAKFLENKKVHMLERFGERIEVRVNYESVTTD